MVKVGKKQTRYALTVVPGDARLDLQAVKGLLAGTYVAFAGQDKAEELASTQSGTILPFSYHPQDWSSSPILRCWPRRSCSSMRPGWTVRSRWPPRITPAWPLPASPASPPRPDPRACSLQLCIVFNRRIRSNSEVRSGQITSRERSCRRRHYRAGMTTRNRPGGEPEANRGTRGGVPANTIFPAHTRRLPYHVRTYRRGWGGSTRRTGVTVVACVGGTAAVVAAALWLASRSDAVLDRWAAVAGVISGGAAVLTLALAVVPLWRRADGGDAAEEERDRRPSGRTVTQTIHSSGTGPVNVVGEGSQVNVNLRLPPREGP